MAERITRRYIDKATGGPITGALIRLVSVTMPGNNPYYMEEIVSADPTKQGYYFATLAPGGSSPAVVPRGVYRVERDFGDGNGYVAWEGEETVSPGRARSASAVEPLIDRLETTQIKAVSFATDAQSLTVGVLPVVQAAIDAATGVTQSKHVIVGASGNIGQFSSWLGDYITVPDGVNIDLSGATLASWSNPNVSVANCTGDVTFRNGTLEILSTDGLGRVVTMQNPAKRAIFIGVTFKRIGTAAPTVAGPAGQECPAIFIGCKNVVLAPPTTAGSSTRLQCAIGCTGVYEVGGAAAIQLDQANVSGSEIGDLIRTALKEAIVAPDPGLPFTDMKEFAEAVKQMWATEIPALKGRDDDLQDQIAVATAASGVSWEWERSNLSDIYFGIYVQSGAPGTITGVTPLRSYQKAFTRGSGKNAVLTLQCAMSFQFLASATTSKPYFGGSLFFNLAEFEAALAAKYPGWGALGGLSLRYTEGGIPGGFFFKKVIRGLQRVDGVNADTRVNWEFLNCNDGVTPERIAEAGFCSTSYPSPIPTKGVNVHIPTLLREPGSYRAVASFEIEIPVIQSDTYENNGALGTILGMPY